MGGRWMITTLLGLFHNEQTMAVERSEMECVLTNWDKSHKQVNTLNDYNNMLNNTVTSAIEVGRDVQDKEFKTLFVGGLKLFGSWENEVTVLMRDPSFEGMTAPDVLAYFRKIQNVRDVDNKNKQKANAQHEMIIHTTEMRKQERVKLNNNNSNTNNYNNNNYNNNINSHRTGNSKEHNVIIRDTKDKIALLWKQTNTSNNDSLKRYFEGAIQCWELEKTKDSTFDNSGFVRKMSFLRDKVYAGTYDVHYKGHQNSLKRSYK
jgi:hypothetical protein